ncbi:MAG: LPS export ABC transporter permease LptG [Pseudomonadota bacterium]
MSAVRRTGVGVWFPATLVGYVARATCAGIGWVALGFVTLAFCIDLIEQLRSLSDADVSMLHAFELAACHVPAQLDRIWPFAVLFGSMVAFWRLNRANELVVVRATGVSAWQFLMPASAVAALIGAVVITTLNPLAAALTQRYERLQASLTGTNEEVLIVFPRGIWLRQVNADGQHIVHASNMEGEDPLQLQSVVVFRYDADGRYLDRLDAPSAALIDGTWRLQDARLSDGSSLEQPVGTVEFTTDIDPARVRDGFRDPATLSFWELPDYIALLESLGFSGREHRVHLQSLLATPVFFAAMLLIGVTFTLRFERRGGLGLLLVGGLIGGFAFFIAVDVVKALGVSGQLPPVLAAWAPTAVALTLGSAALFQLEDG